MAVATPAAAGETASDPHGLAHDLVLPTLLFGALGGMTWAVRGCSGFGAVAGCVFAGVTWGAAWWYLSQSSGGAPARRYDSGWAVLALTAGVGLSGARGWMQWPSFFEGKLVTHAARGEFVPIDRAYGFLWLFVAGVPWAGVGACLLAWSGSRRETRAWHWAARIACGLGAAALARHLFDTYPQYFLPLYEPLEARYRDPGANPNLRRLVNDSGAAVAHMGCYLGFLLYEAARREGKNVALILTVGLVNGLGWALCQNWKWAPGVWPGSAFNFWRCWESSGGVSIGLAFGLAYFLVNRAMPPGERAEVAARRAAVGPGPERVLVYLGLTWLLGLYLGPEMGGWGGVFFGVALLIGPAYDLRNRPTGAGPSGGVGWGLACLAVAMAAGLALSGGRYGGYGVTGSGLALAVGFACSLIRRPALDAEARRSATDGGDPGWERLGLALGVLTGLGLSVRNGLKGWCNLYLGHERYWDRRLWEFFGPAYLAVLLAVAAWALTRPSGRGPEARRSRHAYGLIWLVLAVQNVTAQLVTGPLTDWNEFAFSLYYVLLFFLSATVVFHFHALRGREPGTGGGKKPLS